MQTTRFVGSAFLGMTLLVGCAPIQETDWIDEGSSVQESSLELTSPVNCAVSKPSGWNITPPWGAGLTHKIMQGYAGGMHQYACRTGGSNDYYALDFDLALDEAVYPIADGKVIFAGTATGGYASYGKIVFIEHTVGTDKYHSLYAHLNSTSSLTPGSSVTRGTRIGRAGKSGNQSVVHLHLAIYKNALFSTSGNIGPYGGAAMVPEIMAQCTRNGGTCENFATGNYLTRVNSCGTACTQCVLSTRTDILPFYQANGWDTSCSNRDTIVDNWCGIDPSGCNSVKTGACASVCDANPYPNCPCDRESNYCHHAPQTPGCPMTFPGGYCDPNGDGSYSDAGNAGWTRGYDEYQAYCQ